MDSLLRPPLPMPRLLKCYGTRVHIHILKLSEIADSLGHMKFWNLNFPLTSCDCKMTRKSYVKWDPKNFPHAQTHTLWRTKLPSKTLWPPIQWPWCFTSSKKMANKIAERNQTLLRYSNFSSLSPSTKSVIKMLRQSLPGKTVASNYFSVVFLFVNFRNLMAKQCRRFKSYESTFIRE